MYYSITKDLGYSSKKICPKSGEVCTNKSELCAGHRREAESGPQWFRPTSLNELAGVIGGISSDSKVKLVAGDTGRGMLVHKYMI